MAAIITDQLRILNARNFLAGVTTSGSSYYSFIGLPNATDLQSDWDNSPPAPVDNFDNENEIWETIIGLKKITSSDIKLVVPKITWKSGNTYDMYRHDYSTSNTAKVSGATNLYNSFYVVMNSDYRAYICLQNGTTPETPNGAPSLDEPTFVDLEPRAAGASGDAGGLQGPVPHRGGHLVPGGSCRGHGGLNSVLCPLAAIAGRTSGQPGGGRCFGLKPAATPWRPCSRTWDRRAARAASTSIATRSAATAASTRRPSCAGPPLNLPTCPCRCNSRCWRRSPTRRS